MKSVVAIILSLAASQANALSSPEAAGKALAKLEAFSIVLCQEQPTPNAHEMMREILSDTITDFDIEEYDEYIDEYVRVYLQEERKYLNKLKNPNEYPASELDTLCVSYDKKLPDMKG